MKARYTNLILFFLGVNLCAQAPHKVACVGNSITAGAGIADAANDSYPAQLQKLLGEDYNVLNCGNSGRTMLKNGDFPLWVEPEFKAAIQFVPDIVIILLGTNDSKPWNWEFKDEYIPDYMAMIDTFRSVNSAVNIFACLPPPAFSVQWGIRDSIITTDIIPMIHRIADSTNVNTIDFYTPFIERNVLFPDDIHPNAEGAWEMAKVVYGALTGKTLSEIQDVDVARGKPVQANSGDNCSSPSALVDGDRTTKWSCMSAGYVVVDLGAVETIDLFQTDFGEEGEEFGQYYTIEVSVDSVTWNMVVDKSTQSDSSLRIAVDNIEAVNSRYVRLTPMGPVNALSEAVGAYDFRILRAAPIHAPMLYIDNIDVRSKFTRYDYFTLPCQETGYYKVVRSDDLAEAFTDVKGYRLAASQNASSSIRPDKVQRYFTKAYFDGVEVLSADTLTIDWSISAVELNPESLVPFQFRLQQNYPNPFNPATKIEYQMPFATNVEVVVYNALGKRVRTLVNSTKSAGMHSVVWDGLNDARAKVPSGVYYYRLIVQGKSIQVKKMLLLR